MPIYLLLILRHNVKIFGNPQPSIRDNLLKTYETNYYINLNYSEIFTKVVVHSQFSLHWQAHIVSLATWHNLLLGSLIPHHRQRQIMFEWKSNILYSSSPEIDLEYFRIKSKFSFTVNSHLLRHMPLVPSQ